MHGAGRARTPGRASVASAAALISIALGSGAFGIDRTLAPAFRPGDIAPDDATAAEVRPREGAPFHIVGTLPTSGEAAMVIEESDGRRVRNLFAQVFRFRGDVGPQG